jgi:hypothetical protein
VVDDTALEASFHFDIETVPTLIRIENGQEMGRAGRICGLIGVQGCWRGPGLGLRV